MQRAKFMHGASVLAGILGALALIGAWLAGEEGRTIGLTQSHLYNDAIVLQLVAISAGICAIYRRQLEKEG